MYIRGFYSVIQTNFTATAFLLPSPYKITRGGIIRSFNSRSSFYLDVEVCAVVLLPGLELDGLHLLRGHLHNRFFTPVLYYTELTVITRGLRPAGKPIMGSKVGPESCFGVTELGDWAVPSLNSLTQLLPMFNYLKICSTSVNQAISSVHIIQALHWASLLILISYKLESVPLSCFEAVDTVSLHFLLLLSEEARLGFFKLFCRLRCYCILLLSSNSKYLL